MRLGITGSGGFIGSHLVKYLHQHSITPLKRGGPPGQLEGLDAVIHLAGRNVTQSRWTNRVKQEIWESRVDYSYRLVQEMQRCKRPPKRILAASAIGIYQEGSFLSSLCGAWEKAVASSIPCVNMRFGMVLSKDGGALAKMLPLFRLGLGATIGSTRQWMSWISLSDLMRAIEHILMHPEIEGAIDLVSPTPVTNQEFTKTLACALNRPLFLHIPSFAIQLLFGQMGKELFLQGALVKPNRLLQSGFSFLDPTLNKFFESTFW